LSSFSLWWLFQKKWNPFWKRSTTWKTNRGSNT